MERIWGGQRSDPGGPTDTQSAATRAENQNIGFDWAYVEYTSPIGMFDVGYMDDGGWGTFSETAQYPAESSVGLLKKAHGRLSSKSSS